MSLLLRKSSIVLHQIYSESFRHINLTIKIPDNNSIYFTDNIFLPKFMSVLCHSYEYNPLAHVTLASESLDIRYWISDIKVPSLFHFKACRDGY